MQKLVINTRLTGRDETFRLLALARATGYPVCLVGPKGTGKTNALMDFGTALYDGDEEKMLRDSFILEFDEGTRTSEVKGHPDMNKLLTQHVFERNSPITRAKFVLLNEIDKASPGCRTSLYGIMNERMLFDGEHKVPCTYELLVGAVNEIPEDEAQNPMWDRFVFKQTLSRLSPEQMLAYYEQQQNARQNGKNLNGVYQLEIDLPENDEINSVIFTGEALNAFIQVTHSRLSDRTLTYVQRIAAAASYIWHLSPEQALVKVCSLLTDANLSKELAKKIEPQEVTLIRSKIEMMASAPNEEAQLKNKEVVIQLIQDAMANKKVNEKTAKLLVQEMKDALHNSPVFRKRAEREAAGAATA